jgi:hypothetical protein
VGRCWNNFEKGVECERLQLFWSLEMMLYKEFVVAGVRTELHKMSDIASQEHVVYDLVSREGEKVSFCLIILGCVGQEHYREQYEAIRPYLLPQVRISCRIVYTYRREYLSMGMSSFAILGKNPWEISEWFNTPGVIEFYGDANIPLSNPNNSIKHVSQSEKSEIALVLKSQESILFRVFRALTKLIFIKPLLR